MLGWRRDVVGIARMMLSSLVSLISSTHKRQFSNLSFVGWDKVGLFLAFSLLGLTASLTAPRTHPPTHRCSRCRFMT